MYLPSASTQRPSLTILAIHQVNAVVGGLHSSMLSRWIVQVCRHKTMKKIGPSRRDQKNHRRNFLSLHRNWYYLSRHHIQPRFSRHFSLSCLSSSRNDVNEDERRRDERRWLEHRLPERRWTMHGEERIRTEQCSHSQRWTWLRMEQRWMDWRSRKGYELNRTMWIDWGHCVERRWTKIWVP